ncbi:unnamed protein product [Rotaria magnacalcarata]|uniref:Uncharacterized protein n=2 Tax=Rotaria magnacalcarata TaxID=392030 RepID=A0A816ZCS0_9BILA|nr:unnamed protein product [Rotaria magnacalcarata]CAF4201831.1 unnamed protein product [Rotaria magnacalcarata]
MICFVTYIIKSILPTPNKLPTTFRQILKIFGKSPTFVTKFYCNSCLTLTTKQNGQHYCTNSTCSLADLQLSKRQLTELVTLNIREKLQSIVRRNLSLFSSHEELFPAFDIPSGARYQSTTKNVVHLITLHIHADGAPLVRSTKSAIWPCFSSIVELPPPVREYQSNILTLGLWVSCIKPDVYLFLEDIIEQLTELSENGTTIFVNCLEFKIYVKTQLLVSDLPAKSLFMKTINFNGFVKILHWPKSIEEIRLADKLIHDYCQTSSKVHDPRIELYSLHVHLHLPSQVLSSIILALEQLPNIVCSFILDHGGLAFTSAFCFDSAIRSIKSKPHGTKNLGSQITYWCDIDTIIPSKECEVSSPSLVSEIKLDNDLLNAYRGILAKQLKGLKQDINIIKLYVRFKDKFLTYHSFLYSKRFTCNSYLISHNDNHQQIQCAIKQA